jgi:hypothetical protein
MGSVFCCVRAGIFTVTLQLLSNESIIGGYRLADVTHSINSTLFRDSKIQRASAKKTANPLVMNDQRVNYNLIFLAGSSPAISISSRVKEQKNTKDTHTIL